LRDTSIFKREWLMQLLNKTIEQIKPVNQEVRVRVSDYIKTLTMPEWALGQLLDLAVDISAIKESLKPVVSRKEIFIFAADHGVCEEGVSAYPGEVTAQMVLNFAAGGAAINALSGVSSVELKVVDMGVKGEDFSSNPRIIDKSLGHGTANMTRGPAMPREQAVAALEIGIELASAASGRADILGAGEMGIGNTTSAAALTCCLGDYSVEEIVGRGTGVNDDGLKRKISAVSRALKINNVDSNSNYLEILAAVGGYEIGALTGFYLGAAAASIPVVIDGFICSAAAMLACKINPHAQQYFIYSHLSQELGHKLMLEKIDKKPLLNLGMRLGEGSGAALAMPIIDASIRVLCEMATFGGAGVSEKKETSMVEPEIC